MSIYFVILCLASMYRFHIQGMSKNEGDILVCAEIGYPVPGENALDSYNNVFPEWSYSLQKDFGIGFDVSAQDYFSFLVDDA